MDLGLREYSLTSRSGKIATLEGVDEIAKHPYVFSAYARHRVGDIIEDRGDVTQRVAEFCSYIPNGGSIEDFADYIYRTIQVKDEKGENMIVSKVDIKDSNY